MGIIDHILLTCKRATDTPGTLRHAALGTQNEGGIPIYQFYLALANLALYSCQEAKKKLIQKKLPDWLFLLASQPDDITRWRPKLTIDQKDCPNLKILCMFGNLCAWIGLNQFKRNGIGCGQIRHPHIGWTIPHFAYAHRICPTRL